MTGEQGSDQPSDAVVQPECANPVDVFLDWLTDLRRVSDRESETLLALAFALNVIAQPKLWCGQLFQDAFVATVLGDGNARTFVEIGVGDGLSLSNSARLETLGWTGLLVEPNEVFCDQIAANRPRTRLVRRAVLARGRGTLAFRHVRNFAELSSLELFAEADQHDRCDFEPMTVETVGVEELFRAEGIPVDVDYVSIDVEGPDAEILEALIAAGYRPKVLTIEHNWTESQLLTIQRVLAADYEVVLRAASKWDTWALRRDVFDGMADRLRRAAAPGDDVRP